MELAQLKKAIHDKIEDGTLGAGDIPDYLRVLCAIGNATADIQDEVDGWNCRLQLELAGAGEHWVTVAAGRFECGAGRLAANDVRLAMSAAVAAEIFAGERDAKAAFLTGALKIEGALPNAVKFQSIVEIVVEELEYTAAS
jgi:putative sterol carrier protein